MQNICLLSVSSKLTCQARYYLTNQTLRTLGYLPELSDLSFWEFWQVAKSYNVTLLLSNEGRSNNVSHLNRNDNTRAILVHPGWYTLLHVSHWDNMSP